MKTYSEGDIIFVKINRRIGNKLSPRYKKETLATNYNTTVKTTTGRIVHKKNIRQ